MANNCLDTRLLSYSGTSQVQRVLDALLTNAARVDERTAADLILFTKKYGAYLNYYDLTNAIAGDWQQIMGNDVAVVIATIADWRTQDYPTFLKQLNFNIASATTDTIAENNFKILFDFIFSVTVELDKAFRKLADDVDYTTFLTVSIASKLAAPLSVLSQYYNFFVTKGLINPASTLKNSSTPVDSVTLAQNFKLTNLSAPFIVNPSITAFPITLSGATVQADINHILSHNLFTGTLQSFVDAVTNIVSRTPAYLQETLDNYPTHAPHYALYLTFLKLFSFAQQHLNQFTQRHLDFYYKNVLQLSNNAAEADFVHLTFELQKNISQHLLTAGTTFKAGKDANNNDLYYALTDDIVLQTASVQALKSIYLNKDNTPVTLYASPTANSEDGNGGKLLSSDNSWFPFGNPKNITQANIGFVIASNVLYMNEGNRSVTLTFTCDSLAGITNADLTNIFTIQFTGKKSLYTAANYAANVISNTTFSLTISMEGDAPAIVAYSAKLHGGNFDVALPMVQVQLNSYASYQKIKIPRISGVNISVTVSSVKNLSLQNDDGKINTGKPFKPFGDFPEDGASFIIGTKEIFQKQLSQLTINFDWQQEPSSTTKVALSSLAKGNWVSIDNSVSLYAADIVIKPTEIFSIIPPVFSGFLFDNDLLTLNSAVNPVSTASPVDTTTLEQTATGAGLSFVPHLALQSELDLGNIDTFSNIGAIQNDTISNNNIENLQPGFQMVSETPIYLYIGPGEVDVTGLESVVQSPVDFTNNDDFSVTAIDGFIRLELSGNDYSLSTFLNKIPAPSVAANYDSDGNITGYTVNKTAPPVAAPPALKSVSLDYTAVDNISFGAGNFNNRTNYFYHLEPFGYREMNPAITSDAINLLPVFNLDDATANDDGGELWIGLSNALPDETFSILFEVSDGSANPLKEMTQTNWFYLNNNNWLPFAKQAITDQTNNLTRSGLVIVNVPGDATITNTRADTGLVWIKTVVQHDTDAVCNLIAVTANAAKAQFVQDIADGIQFTKAIAPNTITKPATPDAAVKKIQQPYNSFDGRVKETDNQFYLRVSERLRHKRRAITTWDYERLTLQYFPQIFKAKCLSHTGFILDEKTNTQKYSETLAGQVTVITIPDLTSLTNANPLRPYTSIGLLTEIETYLQGLTSPFVKLHLCNPQFEEVQFEFSVTFRENYDPVFYTAQLNNDIEQFLTPWAFGNPQAIQFGNTIEKSVVLNFIEERYYVDFVTCLTMNQIILRDGATIQQALYNIDEATASTARSILVSYYNETTNVKHLISSPANCDCNG